MSTWHLLPLSIETRGPVALAVAPQAGNVADGRPWVPGRTVRGALAAAWIGLEGAAATGSAAFAALFESAAVRYLPWLPAADGAVLPVPRSALTCKAWGGAPPVGHGVVDTLLAASGDAPLLPANCEQCGSPLQTYRGAAEHLAVQWTANEGRLARLETATHAATHTAIRGGTAAAGLLYTTLHLPAGRHLQGAVLVQDPAAATVLTNLLADCGGELRLGRRSQSQGEVAVTAGPPSEVTDRHAATHGPLPERLARYAARLGGTGFSLLCVTPTILLDAWLQPCARIPAEVLTAALGWEVTVAAAGGQGWCGTTTLLHGWQAAHGLPREADVAIAAGSVGLYHTAAPPGELAAALARLECDGLGERRTEGFGQVLAADPWHLTTSAGQVAVTATPAPRPAAAAPAERGAWAVESWLALGHRLEDLRARWSPAALGQLREVAPRGQSALRGYCERQLQRATLDAAEQRLYQAILARLQDPAVTDDDRQWAAFLAELAARKRTLIDLARAGRDDRAPRGGGR